MSLIFAGGWGWRRNLRRHALIQSSDVHTNTSQRLRVFSYVREPARPKFTFGSVKSLSLSLSISFVQAAESISAPRTHFHNVSASYYTALFLGGGMRNLARGSRRAIPLLREQPREPTMRSALREATSSAVMPKS